MTSHSAIYMFHYVVNELLLLLLCHIVIAITEQVFDIRFQRCKAIILLSCSHLCLSALRTQKIVLVNEI
jgi:hypothetical protein